MNISIALAMLIFCNSKRCPQNWNQVEDKCIFVSKDEATFEKAKINCKTWNSKLFEPRNWAHLMQVLDKGSCDLYFIGAKSEDEEGK